MNAFVQRNPQSKPLSQQLLTVYFLQADDELEAAYLKGFEYDTEECKTRFVVHLTSQPTISSNSGGGKKKKNKKNED